MVLFWIVIVCAVLAAAGMTGLFFYVFYNPSDVNKRQQPEEYARSPMMKKYAPEYKKLLGELQNTPCEICHIKAFDKLKLSGRYYEMFPGAPVDIMFHGYKGHAFGDFCGIFPIARAAGHNVLLVDQRACGDSEGCVISFGIKEYRDCLSWISYIRKRNGKDVPVFLFGVSMGAATVLMASDKIPGNVKGIIADCGYTSPEAIIKKVAVDMKLPVGLCYPLAKAGASVFGQFNLEEAAAVDAVAKAKAPILFIHGYTDSFVPYTMCGELYDACTSEKKMVTINGADHAVSVFANPEKYSKDVLAFIGSCM